MFKKIFLLFPIFFTFIFFNSVNIVLAEEVPTEIVTGVIQNYIKNDNSNLTNEEVSYISQVIIYYSYQYRLDPLVVTALISTESNFQQNSLSHAGAIGLGQIMPDTAVALGINPYDETENIEGTCSYLSTQIQNFSSYDYPVELALAAYNAGPSDVKKYNGIPPYTETQNYVISIRNLYFKLYNNLCYALNNYYIDENQNS